MSSRWHVENMELDLVHKSEFAAIPHGTILYNIFGQAHVVGVHDIDDDTRFGYLAFGYRLENGHRVIERADSPTATALFDNGADR